MSVFTREMFSTGNDRDKLDLVGIAVHGPTNAADKTFKGSSLHH